MSINNIHKQLTGVIYLITNLQNLENNIKPFYYIGSKYCLDEWNKGIYYGSSKLLTEDINKSNKSFFKREILETLIYTNYNDLLRLEYEYIRKYNAMRSSSYYNDSRGSNKWKIPPEAYKRRSKRMKSGNLTDGEIKVANILQEHQNRKKLGIFTEKELESFKTTGLINKKRKQNGDYTDKELAGHIKIGQTRKNRTAKDGLTEKEKAFYKSISIRKKNGLWTEKEIEGMKISSNKIKTLKWINNGIINKRVYPDEIQMFMEDNWKFGRIKKDKKNG